MKKKDFVTQLMKQGWSRYQGSNVERWQRGDALLSISKTLVEDTAFPIQQEMLLCCRK